MNQIVDLTIALPGQLLGSEVYFFRSHVTLLEFFPFAVIQNIGLSVGHVSFQLQI